MPSPSLSRSIDLKKINMRDLKKLNWREIWRSRQFIIIAGVLGVGTVLMVLFAILPSISKVFEVVGLYQQEGEALKQLQQKIAVLEQVSQQTEYQRRDQVEKILPNHKPLLELLTSVSAAAQRSSATITDIETTPGKLASNSAQLQLVGANLVKLQSGGLVAASGEAGTAGATTTDATGKKTSGKSGVQPLEIVVTIRGTLPVINSFTDEIERSVPITNVSQIELDSLNQKGGRPDPVLANQFEAKLTLNTYYFTKTITSAVSDPLPSIGKTEHTFLNNIDQFVFTSAQTPTQVQGGGSGNPFKVDAVLQPTSGLVILTSPSPAASFAPVTSPAPGLVPVVKPTPAISPSASSSGTPSTR